MIILDRNLLVPAVGRDCGRARTGRPGQSDAATARPGDDRRPVLVAPPGKVAERDAARRPGQAREGQCAAELRSRPRRKPRSSTVGRHGRTVSCTRHVRRPPTSWPSGPTPALDARLDRIIALVAAAQGRSGDGYINTWTQLQEPPGRRGPQRRQRVWQHDIYNRRLAIDTSEEQASGAEAGSLYEESRSRVARRLHRHDLQALHGVAGVLLAVRAPLTAEVVCAAWGFAVPTGSSPCGSYSTPWFQRRGQNRYRGPFRGEKRSTGPVSITMLVTCRKCVPAPLCFSARRLDARTGSFPLRRPTPPRGWTRWPPRSGDVRDARGRVGEREPDRGRPPAPLTMVRLRSRPCGGNRPGRQFPEPGRSRRRAWRGRSWL